MKGLSTVRWHRDRLVSTARWYGYILANPSQWKHIKPWLQSLEVADFGLQKRLPWLPFDVIDFLNTLPLQDRFVFEFGSGGSTLYWLTRGANVTSVEHDPAWYAKLRDCYLHSSSVDYRLIVPELTEANDIDPADPDMYGSSDTQFPQHSFRKYCSQIDCFADYTFDIVLVDGRARPSCIKHAINKVKIGGYLILDNSEREYYLSRTHHLLRCYNAREYYGLTPGVKWCTQTTVFVKES